jgi:hypothetical protein
MNMKIEIEGDSRQAVAFALLNMIVRAEGKLGEEGGVKDADRAWLLDTYAECLMAVSGERAVEPGDDDVDEDDGEDPDEGEDAEEEADDEDEGDTEDSKAA